MNNLEKYFKENDEFFNQNEPDEKHFEKFIEKLDERKSKKRLVRLNSFFKYAAILIVLVGFAGIIIHLIPAKETSEIALCDEELERVEEYYLSLRQEKLIKLDEAVKEGKITIESQNDILDKVNELKAENQRLKQKLAALNCDVRIRNAFIDNNIISVEMLSSVLEMLEGNTI